MEILPAHYGAGSVKVIILQVYDENLRLGKTTYSIKVNKLQMRLPYYRIYSNTVCYIKNRK